MKMRKVTSDQIASLEHALANLKTARTAALAGGARKTWRKVHSAIKSCQGAINHAERAVSADHNAAARDHTPCPPSCQVCWGAS